MFQRLYPIKGKPPVEAIRHILAEARRSEPRHAITIGAPPFERDWLNRITALRLCFRQPDAVTARSRS